jgi:hypothetical protein
MFNGFLSSSYTDLVIEAPDILYGDGSTVQGTYATDRVAVGSVYAAGFQFMEAADISDQYRFIY